MMTSTQVYKIKVPMMQATTVTIVSTGTPFESEAEHDIYSVLWCVCVCIIMHMSMCDKMNDVIVHIMSLLSHARCWYTLLSLWYLYVLMC